MIGAGEYDRETMELLVKLEASGVVVLVVGGARGEGFSVCTSSLSFLRALPGALRSTADQIEADVLRLTGSLL